MSRVSEKMFRASPLQDIVSCEDTRATLALLKILALGNQEIEDGRVTPVAEVARRLKAKKKSSVRGTSVRPPEK